MDYMLSTVDNPYSPFDQFEEWYKFDMIHGYNSCGLLARISFTSDSLPENLNQLELDRAIREIVDVNINGMFCLVTKDDFPRKIYKI